MTVHTIHADLTDADTLALVCSTSIASVIVDPPYAPRVHANAVSNNNAAQGPGTHSRDLGFGPLTSALREAIVCVALAATRWSVVFSDIESGHEWRDALEGLDYVRSVPWVRWSQPQKTGDRPPSGAELVTIHHARGRKRWNGPGSLTAFETEALAHGTVLDAKSLRGAEKYSCEKPLDLMLALVSWFSDVGELVCDPCCGVGTTGVACGLLGRDCLQLDASASAVDAAKARLSAPLSDRDRERAQRWVAYQRAWLEHPWPPSAGGQDRYQRALVDTNRVEALL
jgi:hypothetical protein